MAEQPSLQTTKRKRAPRRNYKTEITEVESYCRLYSEILKEGSPTDFGKGQISALEKVLSKIGGKNA